MIRFFLLIFLSFTFSNTNQFNEYFINVAEKGSPSIVSIISEKTEMVQRMPNFFFFDPFEFEDPFKQMIKILDVLEENKQLILSFPNKFSLDNFMLNIFYIPRKLITLVLAE